MTIRKVADIIIRASPNGRLNVTGSGLKFYSYDKNSAAIDFYIQNQDRTPTDLFNVDVKLMLLTRENNEWKQFTAFDGVEIISGLDGHARYVIPDELRGYQGIVEGYVYLDFNDDSRSDECYFNFTIERSRIEEEFEHAGEYYIKEIQDTLDETIAELKKYAAEKIKEYEAQLSSLNSKISNTKTLVDSLATQTTSIQAKQAEILKLIADNNVATKQDIEVAKQESSANVIYQVIGKEKAEITFRLDAKSEFVKVSSVGYTTLLSPTNVSWIPLTEEQLNNLSSLDGSLYSARDVAANYMKQLKYDCDILGFFKSLLGEKFFTIRGATTDSQKVEVLESLITDFTSNVYGYGSGGGINKLTHRNWNGTWTVSDSTAANEVTRIGQTIESTDTNWKKLINGGKISVLSNSEPTISPNYSTVNIDYLCLDVTIELSANEHFEYMIAANHVENLATQDEAESGTDNKKTMTPLRVFQAIAKWTKEKFVNKTGDETIAGAKNFTSTPLVNSVAVAKSDNVLNLIDPQTALGLKNFKNGIQLNGLNIASEYAKAVDTDKYNQKGAVYLGGNVWIAWETLTFQNTSGYSKGSYIRVGSDNNAAFTYPDVKNTTGGYIWLGGACQPDYTDGGFGSYHITIENNFDDARKPIVRFVDSPTTPVKKLAVRGVALIFAPPPTENSKI